MYSACCASAQSVDDCDNNLKGKSLWVLGDSYVANHRCPKTETWHFKAAQQLGMDYHNLGRNGSCIAFDRTKEGFGPQMTQRFREIAPDADFILVIAGHNDAGKTKTPEEWKTFTDSLDYLCSHLRSEYPAARIGFVTPWAVDRPHFTEVIDALKTTAAKHGIPVLDNAYTAGIRVNDPEFRAIYFQKESDTAHLNDAGHNLILPYGVAFIRLLAAQPRP